MQDVYSPSGIPYNWAFFPAEYAETFSRNANQTVARLRCAWDDAGDLKADLMESAQHVAGRKWLTRNLPLQCPEVETQYLQSMTKVGLYHDNSKATSAFEGPWIREDENASGYNTSGGSPAQRYSSETGWWRMDRIHYRCVFGNLPYLLKEDDEVKAAEIPEVERYATFQKVPQSINRKISSQPFVLDRLGAGGAKIPIGETAAVPETTFKLNVKVWMWPEAAVPWAVIYDRANKVNDASVTINGETFAAERVRYDGLAGPPEPYHGSDGQRYVDLVHVLNVNKMNLNQTFDVELTPPDWGYFKLDDGADPPKRRFRKASLKEVFHPR